MNRTKLEDEFESETVTGLLAALSHEHERAVVNYFRDRSAPAASLDELAEHVAGEVRGGEYRSPERVAVRLHHTGLPKLTEVGVVEYDPRSKTVRYRDHPIVEREAFDGRTGVA